MTDAASQHDGSPGVAAAARDRSPGAASAAPGLRPGTCAEVAGEDRAGRSVFVYGTLVPGASAWDLLAPFALSWSPDTVEGALFDTGEGYPALVLGAAAEPAGPVPGAVVELHPGRAGEAIALVDDYEDVDAGLYRRERCVLGSGRHAWTYMWSQSLAGLTRITRWAE